MHFYFGNKNQGPDAKLRIHDESLFRDLLFNPGIGLAEGYMHFIHKFPFANKDVAKHKDTYKSSYPPYIRIL